MSIGHFISILRARWLVIAVAFLLTTVTAGAISLLLPKQYTAVSALVIDSKSPDPINGMVMPGAMMPGYIATQIDVIESERVVRKAIRSMRLNESAQLREQWQDATKGNGVFESWLSDLIIKSLDIKPSRESSVINVSYTAVDPQFAAAMTNAVVQAYIDTTLELRIEPAKQFNVLFDEQSKQARERLEKAQTSLSNYQKAKGIVTTDERLDVETARLNDLSAQVTGLQSLSADAMSRRAQSGVNSPEVLANGVVGALRADYSRQEAKLKELGARYGSAHPAVLELQANINELKSKLDAETRSVTSSVGITSVATQQREAQMRVALEAQREKVLRLKAQRDEASVLVRDVENAQRAYDSIQARYSQSSLESQSNQTNVSVLRTASPPAFATSPRVFLNTLVAAVGGLLLGIGAAFLFELSDRRLRSGDDLSVLMGVPLLGVMPMIAEASGGGARAVGVIPRLSHNRALPELTAPTDK
jgi:succinoglycan biosynthesis transport protein ExoP